MFKMTKQEGINKKLVKSESLEKLSNISFDLEKKAQKIIKSSIHHHQEIVNLAGTMEKEFNILLLFQFLGSLIIFCVALFQMSVVTLF